MVDERHDTRETTLRQRWPWLELFRGFQVAIDPRKLLLAALGIVAMALGWWVLAAIFNYSEPQWPGAYKSRTGDDNEAWNDFKEDRRKWNVMHQAAGEIDDLKRYDEADVADTRDQYDSIKKAAEQDYGDVKRAQVGWAVGERQPHLVDALTKVPGAVDVYGRIKPVGELRTLPWSEYRGRNPYLVLASDDRSGFVYTLGRQVPVLVEPLIKFVRPIALVLQPGAGPLVRFYCLLVILWTLAVWALIGGAITRMAAVEVARREKLGMVEAIRFAVQRFLSFFSAPLFPLVFVAILVVLVIIYGFFHWIPVVGDVVVDGVFWWLILLAGLVMALVLVGLVGWPLMSATISAEGTDSWEAVSRSYSYVFQAPWHYLWYAVVALAYGAVLIFFVSLMASMTAYLGKWALSQNPVLSPSVSNREPQFLFVYAPTSYQWRTLLVDGAKVKDTTGTERYLVTNGVLNETAYQLYVNGTATNERGEVVTADEKSRMTTYNKIGAFLVAIWVGLLFLLMIGFGYSYFWCSATIIYLLMRRNVDDADLDEIYLEEEDQDDFYKDMPKPAGTTPAPSPAPASAPGAPVTMVEPPTLRVSTPAPTATVVATPPVPPLAPVTPPVPPPTAPISESSPPPPASGDGNPPPVP